MCAWGRDEGPPECVPHTPCSTALEPTFMGVFSFLVMVILYPAENRA